MEALSVGDAVGTSSSPAHQERSSLGLIPTALFLLRWAGLCLFVLSGHAWLEEGCESPDTVDDTVARGCPLELSVSRGYKVPGMGCCAQEHPTDFH